MSTAVTVAALASALMHATWSSMAYRFRDQALGFVMMAWVSLAVGLGLVLLAEPPRRDCWPFVAASVVVHVGYTVALTRANDLAQFTQVYPISRGLAPVLVAGAVVVGVGDGLDLRQGLSVGVIVVGLLVFASVRADRAALGSRAVPVAAGVSVLIATYTVIDGIGVREAGTAVGYMAWLATGQGALTVAVLGSRGDLRRRLRQHPELWTWALVGGVLAVAGYGTTVWAQQHGSLAVVAALRETSIVFATLIGVVVLREGAGARRVVASLVVVAGIVLLHAGA